MRGRDERTQANVKTRKKTFGKFGNSRKEIYITVKKNYLNLQINLYTIRNKTFICVNLLSNNITWSPILLAIQNARSNNILLKIKLIYAYERDRYNYNSNGPLKPSSLSSE